MEAMSVEEVCQEAIVVEHLVAAIRQVEVEEHQVEQEEKPVLAGRKEAARMDMMAAAGQVEWEGQFQTVA
ncbi:hypothetical protein DEV92_11622 [Phyllobacterium myrsinacearum]|nr:hypothetical protein DEV92_11622 [Phyllobacterium myrsinacearum]RZS76682.1 hypothetical protein EV217_4897 [Phyllobacterium myrsinacearum]RZU96891.1 hypothetical protein EV654_5075 [Phyllobacterium myrsinacearum]